MPNQETIHVGGGFKSAAEEFVQPVPEQKHFRSKSLGELTAAELKQRWQEEKPEEFEQTDPLYQMPIEDLYVAAEKERIAAEEQALDARQTANAITWMNAEKRYKKTPKNAELMEQFIRKQNMDGTVADFQLAFDILNQKGLLETNPVEPAPKKIYTEDELRAMSADQLREVVVRAHQDGIF